MICYLKFMTAIKKLESDKSRRDDCTPSPCQLHHYTQKVGLPRQKCMSRQTTLFVRCGKTAETLQYLLPLGLDGVVSTEGERQKGITQ